MPRPGTQAYPNVLVNMVWGTPTSSHQSTPRTAAIATRVPAAMTSMKLTRLLLLSRGSNGMARVDRRRRRSVSVCVVIP